MWVTLILLQKLKQWLTVVTLVRQWQICGDYGLTVFFTKLP